MQQEKKFNVGGVLLPQPFKIRRLGHFGFNVVNMAEAYTFYTDLLGFRVSDSRDDAKRLKAEQLIGIGDTRGYFMRFGSDHHAFVLYNKRARDLLDVNRSNPPCVTINQITWQVGSLAEVVNGHHWFVEQERRIRRVGRDMPGSNWHTYLFDPDQHVNELYYGIEQIGWSGHSKPKAMHVREFQQPPELPQIGEFDEVNQAIEAGTDLTSGYRDTHVLPATFDVDGVLLPRPFKIVRIGPVSLFMEDMDAAETFYRDIMGFTVTEDVIWEGHRCVFLRANTEHHCLALYPIALRDKLGLSPHTTSMAFGVQVANYRQLREAVQFLIDRGAKTVEIPAELHPGIDYVAHVLDPDGHVLQFYYQMEQIGWDGKAQPKEARRKALPYAEWPEALEASIDDYRGEPYLGPWG